jgi:hypothetical protein
MATMTLRAEPLFEERGILEEIRSPKGLEVVFVFHSGGVRGGRARGHKVVERRENAKEGPIAVVKFRSAFRWCEGEGEGEPF